MAIQEILQEILKIADNNSFVNFSYIGDVEEMKLQPGFEYPGFAVQNYSYDEETKTYYLSMYLISEDKTLEQACLNAIKDIVYIVNLKHLDLGIVIKSDNILIITAGKLNGAYCSMQLQMTLTSCVCEDKPGYVSSVNGQTGDVILDIPVIESTVIDVNGQTGHVVLDIPEKLSDLYQDIEYATPAYVDEKVTEEHNYTDSVKSNLEDEIGKLVTGVSSVNGSTGDVVIFIPKMTSDLENDSDFIDSEYVDNLIESLNSSINTNYAKKSELNTAIANEVSRADNAYAKKTDIPTNVYTKQEVDDKDENIIANTSLNFATKTQLNTAISDEVSRADEKYSTKNETATQINIAISNVEHKIPIKLSELEQDINYANADDVYTKDEVDAKIPDTSKFADKEWVQNQGYVNEQWAFDKFPTKNDLAQTDIRVTEVDTKVDNLVTGVSSVNGMKGDVTIETGTDEAKVKEIISSEMYAIYIPGIATSVENADKEIIANASINYLLKTDYIAPDVDKEYVDTEIGKLVTGVSSVNGMKGDVTIETVDSKYVDDKFDTLNSSVNANFQVKGDYATNERVNNVEALIPTDVVEHAEIADFVTNSSITENYYKKSEVDNKIETLDSSVSEHYVKKGEVPQDVYSKEEVDTLFTEYDETVDSTYEKKGHYDNKISEIDSSISDVSTRLAGIKIPTDYVKTADYSADKEAQATRDSEQDVEINKIAGNISSVDTKVDNLSNSTSEQFETVTGQINGVSDRVSTIELNYVNNKTFTDKTSEIDSSISDVSSRIEQLADVTSLSIEAVSDRVSTIEGDYVKHDEIEHFVTDSSVSVNYATKSELDELKLFKFPNVTIIGEPTINNGQVSDFSVNDYLVFPFLVNFRDRAFEINFDIKTGSNVTAQENILDSDYGLAFAVRNSRFVMAVSTNGTSWNLGEIIGSHEILPDTSYRVKISYDRLRYKVQYSTDGGQTYIDDATKTAANLSPFPKQMYIGVGEVNAAVKNVFSGIINLNYANLLINGELVWQGMDDVGLATRLAVDMSNIDPAGEQKVKDIIATEGYIKELPPMLDYVTKDLLNSSLANVSSWVNSNFARKSSLEGLITEADADKKYYGKTAGEGLYNYVHTELDGEITDLYKKDQEIDSSISDVSSRLKTVKDTVDGLDNVYVKSETYNIDKNAQAEVNQDVTTKLGKINTSIGTLNSSVNAIENAGFVTETWVSEQGYLDADDKAELEGKINSKQDAGDYATNARVNEVEGKIPEVKDFVTNSSISTNYYNKTEIDNKGYLNKVTADGYYQEKGNYVNETVYSKKVSEIDSSISDVSARLKTANDNIANKADLSELANYYTNSQGTALEGRVSSAELNITGLQEDIQTLDRKIPTDYVSDSSISTNYYMKKDVYNKEETEGFIGGLRTEISNTYELKGHYDSAISTLNSSVNAIENAGYATESWVSDQGYLNAVDKTELEGQINGKQDAGDYATNTRVNDVEGKIPTDYVNTKTFTDKTTEIDSSINDVSSRLKTANDNIANKADKTELDNYYTNSQGTALEGRVSVNETDISNIKNAGYVTESWVSSQGYLDLSDKSELEGKINSKQDAGDYALKADIKDFVTNSSISTNYYKKTEIDSKGYLDLDDKQDLTTLIDAKADNSTVTTLSGKVDDLETTVGNKQDTLVSGTNIKTINGNNILGNGNIEIKAGIDFLTPETIVKIDKTNLEFIADLTTTSENKARSILINSGEQYYYELISGDGHTFYDAYGSEKQFLWRSEVFTWDSNSFNTKDGYDNDDGNYNEIYNRTTNSVGKLYKYLGSIEEKPLETYIKDTAEGGGGEEHVSLTYEEWQNLPYDEQMADKVYLIKDAENVYQTPLVSGTNIKTINNESILGSGNIEIKSGDSTGLNYYSEDYDVHIITGKDAFEFESQPANWLFMSYDEGFENYVGLSRERLEIKYNDQIAVFSTDGIVGGGSFIEFGNIATKTEVSAKQDTLVSGTNIKTINGENILGEGNIVIQGGGSGSEHQNITQAEYDALTPELKQADIVYFITDADVVYATTAYVDEKIGDINTILESI